MKKTQKCVYCRIAKATTRDHIPAATMFAKPRPPNLITVPCCEPCNTEASKDDEYFRLMLITRADIGDHSAAQPLMESVHRSLENHAVSGLARSFVNNVSERNIISSDGNVIGRGFGFDVDLSRLDRVAKRICMGLYFKKYGSVLPLEMKITAWSYDGLRDVDDSQKALLERMIARIKTDNLSHDIGNGAFSYFYRQVADRNDAGAWVLSFFDQEMFLCLTSPANDSAY